MPPLEVGQDSTAKSVADDAPASAPEKQVATTSGRSVFWNMVWNWSGVAVEAAVGLVMAPFLIRALGDEVYGVWIVIGSLTSYFGMMDLGMRGAVGRFVAIRLQQKDERGIEEVLGTAVAALTGVSITAVILLVVLSQFTSRIFSVGPDRAGDVTTAMMIVAVQLGFAFFSKLFDATLWAMQRFDLLNKIDIPTTIFRALSMYVLVKNGGGLIALATISITCALFSGSLKMWFTYRLMPNLRVNPGLATRPMLSQLVDFGFWNFIIQIAIMARTQLIPLSIGAVLGAPAVVPFSLVARLIGLSNTTSTSITAVFSPLAMKLYAKGDEQGYRKIVDQGGRLGLCIGIYFASLFMCLGGSLFAVWIRPDFAKHGLILSILGAGEILPLAMAPSQSIIQAMARHRRLAQISVIEAICAFGGGGVGCYFFGLVGGATVIALSSVLFRGLIVWYIYCKLTRTPLVGELRQIFMRPILSAIAPVMLLESAVLAKAPSNWTELFAYGIGFTVVYGASVIVFVVGWKKAWAILPGRIAGSQRS